MGRLEFVYGAVMSGKTAEFIKRISEDKGNYIICKPDIDFKVKGNAIVSRNGTTCSAKVVFSKDTDILNDICFKGVDRLYVDEAQFLTKKHVDDLRKATLVHNVDVYCYGIIKDFRGFLFEGSTRLIEVADLTREITANCCFCKNIGSFNIKLISGDATLLGEKICVNEKDQEFYYPSCYPCYVNHLGIK